MAQASLVSTTRRAALATVTGAAVLAAIPVAGKLGAANLAALSNEFDRLAAYETRLWRGFDGIDANTQAAITATQVRIDTVIEAIDALPGTTTAELKLKARAVAYFGDLEIDGEDCARDRLVASIISQLTLVF